VWLRCDRQDILGRQADGVCVLASCREPVAEALAGAAEELPGAAERLTALLRTIQDGIIAHASQPFNGGCLTHSRLQLGVPPCAVWSACIGRNTMFVCCFVVAVWGWLFWCSFDASKRTGDALIALTLS